MDRLFFPKRGLSVTALDWNWMKNSPTADFFVQGLNEVPEIRIDFNTEALADIRNRPIELQNLQLVAPALTTHPAFVGMPWRQGPDCQLETAAAKALGDQARSLRRALITANKTSRRFQEDESASSNSLWNFRNLRNNGRIPREFGCSCKFWKRKMRSIE